MKDHFLSLEYNFDMKVYFFNLFKCTEYPNLAENKPLPLIM